MSNTYENFVGPHEIHVTVDPESNPDHFRAACDAIGVKAHIIYNETPQGETSVDLLTGSDYTCSSAEAFTELGKIASGLHGYGLEVVRQKIETVPQHPAAPVRPDQVGRPGAYFESHFTLPDLPTIHEGKTLHYKGVPFYISTTDSKRAQGLLFATMRYYDATSGEFCRTIDNLYDALSEQLKLSKPTVEYALYDSNPKHDKAWVESYERLVS